MVLRRVAARESSPGGDGVERFECLFIAEERDFVLVEEAEPPVFEG